MGTLLVLGMEWGPYYYWAWSGNPISTGHGVGTLLVLGMEWGDPISTGHGVGTLLVMEAPKQATVRSPRSGKGRGCGRLKRPHVRSSLPSCCSHLGMSYTSPLLLVLDGSN